MNEPKFKILSIDGGGIRGIIPCVILKFIEETTGNPISKMFDVIGGTSTGGIISMGLTMPDKRGKNMFTAEQMLELYMNNGQKIFSRREKDIVSRITGNLVNLPYESKGIDGLLKEYFGETRLKDALTNVLVTTYEMKAGKPFYFSSRLAQEQPEENYMYTEVARSTSAAPTYFKPSAVTSETGDNYTFVDGGIFANNPAILTYCEAKELWKKERQPVIQKASEDSKGFDAIVTGDNDDLPFFMLSLGTAYTRSNMNVDKLDGWRNAQWMIPLVTDVFSRSVAESTHYTMEFLLPPYADEAKTRRYRRLNTEINEDAAQMDNVTPENLQRLLEIGEALVKENKDELMKICEIIG